MKRYGNEYKEEALELAREIGVRGASERLGISSKTLYGWRSAAQDSVKKTATDEQKRMRELEREVDELRRANEILKKAMGFLIRYSENFKKITIYSIEILQHIFCDASPLASLPGQEGFQQEPHAVA